LLTINNNNWHK